MSTCLVVGTRTQKENLNFVADEITAQAALLAFYDSIDDMAEGKGLDRLIGSWQHADHVTCAAPTGDWALGWDAVLAIWQVFASFGRPGRGGGVVETLHVQEQGDFAYAALVFRASDAYGGSQMNCSNVLEKIQGDWKIVHHHADHAPAMGAALERLHKQQQ